MPKKDKNICRNDTRMLGMVFLLFMLVISVCGLSQNQALIKSHKTVTRHNLGYVRRGQVAPGYVHSAKQEIDVKANQQCIQIKYSIPTKNYLSNATQCTCPKGTKKYQTKDGYKCLSPQPVYYPQFVDLICGFLAFLIPAIVAYVCRHKEEVQRIRNSTHHNQKQYDKQHERSKHQSYQMERHKQKEKNGKLVNLEGHKKHTTNAYNSMYSSIIVKEKSSIPSPMKLQLYASSIDVDNRTKNSQNPRISRYASSTDSPRSRSKYAIAKDIDK